MTHSEIDPLEGLLVQVEYNPSKTSINEDNLSDIIEDKLADWLKEKVDCASCSHPTRISVVSHLRLVHVFQVTGDLEEVPGIGPANKQILADNGVENTYQLIGKYLTFKQGDVKQHQDAMFAWLKDIVRFVIL